MAWVLCDADVNLADERLRRAVKWKKARQILGLEGDWRVYHLKLAFGAFAFEYHGIQ